MNDKPGKPGKPGNAIDPGGHQGSTAPSPSEGMEHRLPRPAQAIQGTAPSSASGLRASISREELAALPIRRYEGRVVVVDSPSQLDEARSEIGREKVVGLDTETRPAFRKGESYLPCLVQVATAAAVYLFPLRYADARPVIAGLLEGPSIIKAGVGLAFDLRQLRLVFPFAESNVVELGTIARGAGLEQAGVRNLAGLVLGYRIPKGNRTSNWAAPRLSDAQVTYAATDAWVCRELYLRFEAMGMLRHGARFHVEERPAAGG